MLKVKFGSAWPGENRDSEIVSIPGLMGKQPKEISLKTLSKIINARVVEIVEQVFLEIKNYGHEDQKKKLIGGVVLTGGGSQLNHLKQLVEYITGMDTRIGYPSEHLAGDTEKSDTSPILATAVGLLMNAIEQQDKNYFESSTISESKVAKDNYEDAPKQTFNPNPISSNRKSILDRWAERFKEFLDKA